ncbi:MAG: hypothetical protein Q9P14_03825 [candidate division KSB1 bacterium]|nr:hypothetical protein [candidate division KSB1 bacterium]
MHVTIFRWIGALALCVFFLSRPGQAQIADLQRPYEPVIINGSAFPELSGDHVPVNELFLFAYDAATQSWRQVPMQIDEVDSTGSFFGASDGLLDDNDQIVFMASDAGDRAPFNDWIDDADARLYTRFEIGLSDPLSGGAQAYLYLYRSATLTRDGVTSYMQYIPPADTTQFAADTIKGLSYAEGHNVATGLPDYLSIFDATNGTITHDLMDLLKVRIQTKFFSIHHRHHRIQFSCAERQSQSWTGSDHPRGGR